MIPNPLPLEGCTPEESITYLENHIINLNEKISNMEADRTENTRAWAVDRAVRLYERSQTPPSPSRILEIAKEFIEFTTSKVGE